MAPMSRTSSSSSLSASSSGSSDLTNSLVAASAGSPATSSEGSATAHADRVKRSRASFESDRGETTKKIRGRTEHVQLATYPTQHLLHLLAALLQHIATTNDGRRQPGPSVAASPVDAFHPITTPYPRLPYLSPMQTLQQQSGAGDSDYFSLEPSDAGWPVPDGAPLQPVLAASKHAYRSRNATLGFHARNVPGIGIEQYLLRILKYCPTTNEVFISLLVYFDRMARYMPPPSTSAPPSPAASAPKEPPLPPQRPFCVDSFNVHRLVIAGLTVASKFFSDVFYTNSRYAKVGGLPLHELNQLELQFLLLNDFALVIPVAELQAYADRLLLPAHAQRLSPVLELASPAQREPRERHGSESTSGSSTIGGRSDTSSVASSTGTITGSDRMEVDSPRPGDSP